MVNVTETKSVKPDLRGSHTTKKSRGFGQRLEARTGWMFMLPFMTLFVVTFLIPIVVSLRSAFFAQRPAGNDLYGGGELVDTFVGFDNLIAAATNESFWGGMLRVMAFAVIQIPMMIVGALVLALLLDSFIVRRPAVFRLSFFLPYAVPGIIAAMMWVYLYTPQVSPILQFLPEGTELMTPETVLFSMANITTWTYTGYNMLIFLSALQAVPRELYEAARIDGASGFQVAMKIKVPLMSGATLLAVLLSIIGTIQLFNEPVIIQATNSWMSKDFTPMMLTLNSMSGELSPSGSGPASAYSLLLAVIAGVLAVIYAQLQRRKGD